MNEERQQAYLNLIRSLLDSPSGEESEILAANQELLDAGFVQKVEEVAQMCSQHGDENTANWLQSLAMQLGEGLNLDNKVDLQSLSEEEIQTYSQFLMEVLQTTADSRANSQLVYPLLATNIDKLDEVLAEILRRWGINKLGEAKADEAENLAKEIFNFSALIQQFPLGNKASNMEIAITGYEIVLKVFIREALPQAWAVTQNNLANAYKERIKGDKADNIEIAIAVYDAVLTVITREASPQQWAATQNNLAAAYYSRIKGDRAENIENAIASFTNALSVYTKDAFPQYWVQTQCNLGKAYSERIFGEEAQNIKLAIASYTNALSVYTKDAFPEDWATVQNILGAVYCDRIFGEKAENIELAIASFTKALEVRTKDAFPQDWAQTQFNLGNAYGKRIFGEEAQNIELAIAYYRNALSVYTKDAFLQQWADTQFNLGKTYDERIFGEKAENIELAIKSFTNALSVRTKDAFPQQWAGSQNQLGIAYGKRIFGEKAENIELAIKSFTNALSVRTKDAFPQDWADTQHNLGNAYFYRILEKKAQNLEDAIASYTKALEVKTKDAFPKDWADMQNHLGNAYRDRILGDKAQNLEDAIASYTAALSVLTRDTFPQNWAITQNNLGIAYFYRILGKKAQNLEDAIASYTDALSVYTKDAFLQARAQTQSNLGNAYCDRILGDKAQNLELAIQYYSAALSVLTRDAFPQDWADTQFNLGIAYQNKNDFTLAYSTFESAIVTIESLREEIVSGEESKRKQAEQFNKFYSRMVEVCLQLNKITEAIEYVERSKTRNLVEQILERDSKTIFPPEVFTQLEKYRDEIAVGQYQIQNGKAENPQVLAQHLQELRQQRNKLQNTYLPVGYGFKFDSFQPTLNEHTAIIEWYILNDKILAFIVTKKGELTVWQSKPEDQQALYYLRNQYLQNYYIQKDQWLNNLGESLKELASILHIDEILNQIPKHCDQLILIPHRFLHLLPLHALPVNHNAENSRCLLDLFAGGVSYAPSCQLLQQLQQRKRPDFQSLFAIQNPTGDLNYTDLEVQVIQSYFNPANVLKKTAATLTAIDNSDLNTYHCAHFSCHGYFNLANPGKSALILADAPIADTPTKPDSERYLNVRLGETHDLDKCLTLDKIFTLKLDKCRLVTLSACETGLINPNNASDEYFGLPSGFLLAGSPSVVSSLWKVNDLSTSFLMIKFYENLVKLDNLEAGDIAIALKQAQNWLRNLTIEELDRFLEEHKAKIETVLAQLRAGQRIIFQESLKLIKQRQPLPFANPYYWAGFTASGL